MTFWTEREILDLALRPEGQFLEKKSCWEQNAKGQKRRRSAREVARDVAETLLAMTSADGGVLLVGVEDDGDIAGFNYPEDKVQLILNAPKNLVRPPLPFRFDKIAIQGKPVIVYEVGPSVNVHQLTDGRYLLRIGESNMPFPAEDIERLKQGKRRTLYERTFVSTAFISDLDEDLIKGFGDKTKLNGAIENILTYYRLIDTTNGRTQVTLAALLLFAKDPLRWHPRCGIDFVKYEGTERKHGAQLNIVKRVRLEYSLVTLIEESYRTVSAYIREKTVLHDLFFREKFEYPAFAWQEAIINAVAHRDYSIEGLSIEIWMFDDRMEIRSPGIPVEPVTIERLLRLEHIHASRNPLMVRVLTDLGYMRETGEGIPRMFEVMEKEGLYPPELKIEAESIFTVALKNQPVYTEDILRWLHQFEKLDLSGNQKRLLVWAKEHGGIFTSRNYQKLAGVDIYTASKDIKTLIRKGIVYHEKKGDRTYQLIAEEERLPPMPDDLKRVLPLIEKQGSVKNSDVQELLNVPRWEAKKLLKEWVNSGWLELSGKGRGTCYKSAPERVREMEQFQHKMEQSH